MKDNDFYPIRLQAYMAKCGVGSRRACEELIREGHVMVNNKVIREMGVKVGPDDVVQVDTETIEPADKLYYIALNKPRGYVCTNFDPNEEKYARDLIGIRDNRLLFNVGRLDKDSNGLIIFTNDGDLTRQLTHPSYKKKKIYQVTLDKPLTRADMDRIAEGIMLEDGEIYADEISYVKENKQEVGIEIHSGRNRIVRRIFEFLGYNVTKLDRVYYAGLTKKNLKRGAWRFLTREEVERLKSGQYE